MYVNQFKINLTTLQSGTTATTINIPINMEYQIVDNAELVDRVFVDVETEKNINPIIDYEKVRFMPLDLNNDPIDKIVYNVNLINGNTYASAGFTDDDVKFRKDSFKQTFLDLFFYDSDNPLSQNLVTNITLFSRLTSADLEPQGSTTGIPGQARPANQILIRYTLENPIFNPMGFSEGYHIYDYKDELQIDGPPKYLYMRAFFKNAKTGTTTNMMVKQAAQPIDMLVHELYTRYILFRTSTGYYYRIDDTYQGNGPASPNNITYQQRFSRNNIFVNLYQINAL